MNLPHTFTYTHIYDHRIAELQDYGVNVYASVHGETDIEEAKKAGFNLFAFATKIPKKKGGTPDAPKYIDLPVLGRTLVCPEQRMGRKRVTCDKCKWCVEGKGNVAFLEG